MKIVPTLKLLPFIFALVTYEVTMASEKALPEQPAETVRLQRTPKPGAYTPEDTADQPTFLQVTTIDAPRAASAGNSSAEQEKLDSREHGIGN